MHTVRNKMIRSLPKNFDLIDWKKSLTIEIVNPSGIRLLQTCRNYAWSHDRHLKMCVWNDIETGTTNASSKRNEKSTKVYLYRFWEILSKMWNIKIKCGVSRSLLPGGLSEISIWANARKQTEEIYEGEQMQKNLTGSPEASVARRLSASAWNTFSNKIQAMILMTLLQNIFKITKMHSTLVKV